jgi:uncharacterized membrane protein
MTLAADAQQKIDAYLKTIDDRLRGLSSQDRREIVEELRSHILEKTSVDGGATLAGVDAALAALGNPEDLAKQYVTDEVLAQVEASRSPFRVVDSLFRWASVSATGFLVLLVAIPGYFFGIAFILVAALKPFHPGAAGLWVSPDAAAGNTAYSLHMGFGSVPAVGHEVMGWWIMPVGLLVGCGVVVLTTRFALWCARQYRRSRALPHRG